MIAVSGGSRIYTLQGAFLADGVGKLICGSPVPVQIKLDADNKPRFSNLGTQAVDVQWQPADGPSLQINLPPGTAAGASK